MASRTLFDYDNIINSSGEYLFSSDENGQVTANLKAKSIHTSAISAFVEQQIDADLTIDRKAICLGSLRVLRDNELTIDNDVSLFVFVDNSDNSIQLNGGLTVNGSIILK